MALSKRRHCLKEIGYGPSHGSFASTRCSGVSATDAFVSVMCMCHQPPRHMNRAGRSTLRF